jgi:hypothetical protein
MRRIVVVVVILAMTSSLGRVPYEKNGDSLADPDKSVLLGGKGAYDLGTIKVDVEPQGD